MLGIGNFFNRSCKSVKADNLGSGSVLGNKSAVAANNNSFGTFSAFCTLFAFCSDIFGAGNNSIIRLGNDIIKLGNATVGIVFSLGGRFYVNIFRCKSILGHLGRICKQGLGGSVLGKHTFSRFLRGFGSALGICGRRGNVSKTEIINAVYSTAKLIKIFLKKISVLCKKLCDIIAYTFTGDVAYIAFIVDIIVCVIYVGGRLIGR